MHARVLEQYQTWYHVFKNLLLCHATLLFLSFLCVPSIVAAAIHADIHCQCSASTRYISVFTVAEFHSTTTPLGRMEEPLLVSRTNKVALNSLMHRSLWAHEGLGWTAGKRHWLCSRHRNRSFQDSFTDFPSRRSQGRSLGLHIEFDMFACLLGVKCYFIIVLIWIPLITCGDWTLLYVYQPIRFSPLVPAYLLFVWFALFGLFSLLLLLRYLCYHGINTYAFASLGYIILWLLLMYHD